MSATHVSPAIQKALKNIPPDIMDALRAARGPKEALKKFQDTPEWWIVFNMVQQFLAAVNTQLPQLFTQQDVDLFGLPNNRLDPLNFNGRVSAHASGEYCTPQYCNSIGWIEVCIPPFSICADGQASASLYRLTGLGSMQITNFSINDVAVNGNKVSTTGSLSSYVPQLQAPGEANASGGPSGFSIPVSGSGSASITGLVMNATIAISCTLDPPKVTALNIETLTMNGKDVNLGVQVDGLGPFDNLLGGLNLGLTIQLAGLLGLMGMSDQELTNAIKGEIQTAINSQL